MMKALFITTGFAFVILFTACKKNGAESNSPNSSTPLGLWAGTGQYGSSPAHVMTMNFKANGTVDITGNNGTTTDNATGSWLLTGETLTASYQYAGSSAAYTLSGRFTSSLNALSGTIGQGIASSVVGSFYVSRQ